MQNDTIKLLLSRKTIRAFDERPISVEDKEQIISAMMRAPTAGNTMLYSVLDITDQEIKDVLSISCDHQPFIAKAPMVLIFLADYRRLLKRFQQANFRNISEPCEGDLLLAMNDAIIAAHTACVAAESLGIGSCYIGDILENFETHKAILDLPEYVAPISMLVFGYKKANQKDKPLLGRFDRNSIVFENRYRDLNDEENSKLMTDDEALDLYVRKYTADFSVEMRRSAKEIIKNWQGFNDQHKDNVTAGEEKSEAKSQVEKKTDSVDKAKLSDIENHHETKNHPKTNPKNVSEDPAEDKGKAENKVYAKTSDNTSTKPIEAINAEAVEKPEPDQSKTLNAESSIKASVEGEKAAINEKTNNENDDKNKVKEKPEAPVKQYSINDLAREAIKRRQQKERQ